MVVQYPLPPETGCTTHFSVSTMMTTQTPPGCLTDITANHYVSKEITGEWSKVTGWGSSGGCNNNNECLGGYPIQVSDDRVCGSYWNRGANSGFGAYNDRYEVQCGPDLTTNAVARTQICPSVGVVVGAEYAGNLRGPHGQANTNVKVKCSYVKIKDEAAFNEATISAVFAGSSTSGTIKSIRDKLCLPKTFTDLNSATGHAGCRSHYTANGTLNSECLARILLEKPTTWPDDPAMLSKMLDIMVSQTAAATDAKDMMARYCSITNPQWADNDPMRTFINELIKPSDPAKTNPALQATATDLAMQYCLANPTSLHCGCWNAAVNKGYQGCSLDANKDLPGCRGLYDLKQTFKQAPASMASVITPIENAIKPGCFAAECKSSKASSADVNLRTSDITNCTDTINICLQSVTVGGDMRGTLNQACNINVSGGGANTGGLPTSLQQTLSGGNVVTSTDGLTRTVDGVSIDVAALIIKPGKSVFVDKYLPTPQKQKMAIGGVVAIVVLCFCLIVLAVVASSSGGEKGSSDIGAILAMQAQQQAAASAASQNAMRAQLSGLKKLAAS